MLTITIPDLELWDEEKEQFVTIKGSTLQLEHSLVSMSKWESKWHKSYLNTKEKTPEETVDYIRCMTITQNVNPLLYPNIPEKEVQKIIDYIEDPMTATTISDDKKNPGRQEIITSELIYYWMTAFNIPQEYQKWHLNRLITLIRVCERKNRTPEKKSPKEVAKSYAALNKARRSKLHSKG